MHTLEDPHRYEAPPEDEDHDEEWEEERTARRVRLLKCINRGGR
jgi:hypothetical protein